MRVSAAEDFSCLNNRHWHSCKQCREIAFLVLFSGHFRESLPLSTLNITAEQRRFLYVSMCEGVRLQNCKLLSGLKRSSSSVQRGVSWRTESRVSWATLFSRCAVLMSDWMQLRKQPSRFSRYVPTPLFALVLLSPHFYPLCRLCRVYISRVCLHFQELWPVLHICCPPHTFFLTLIFHSLSFSVALSLIHVEASVTSH